MGKLHELLAVENNLEGQAKKCLEDLTNTFDKKRHHFEEKRVTFISNEENVPAVVETQSDIQTTVKKEFAWVSKHVSKLLDASLQVAEANTRAKADVVLENGVTLLTGVPATALLELEKRLSSLKTLVSAAPTLDPSKGFSSDSNRGDGFYVAREVNKSRTRKAKKAIVLFPATDKHPAQTQLVDEDVNVGTIKEQEWSSMLTVSEKGELLERVEELTRAVRKARSKANEVEVNADVKIGDKLLNYVFHGK